MYCDPSGHFVTWIFAVIAAVAIVTVGLAIAGCTVARVGHYIYKEKSSHADKNLPLPDKEKKNYSHCYSQNGITIYYELKPFNKYNPSASNKPSTSLKVYESWRYSENEILAFLLYLRDVEGYSKINVERMKNEWIWHNVAYCLNIGVKSNKDVDVNFNMADDNPAHAFIFDYMWW